MTSQKWQVKIFLTKRKNCFLKIGEKIKMVWNWKVMWKVINITILTGDKRQIQVFKQMSGWDSLDGND